MASEAAQLFAQAAAWQSGGRRVALATVLKTWGSSPRPPGSMLLISDHGQLAGSVSGGCIEGAVATAAHQVLQDARPQRLSFGVSHAQAWEVGLSCGGQVEVLVTALPDPSPPDRTDADLLSVLRARLAARQLTALCTDFPSGAQRVFPAEDLATDPVSQAAHRALALDQPVLLPDPQHPDAFVFVQPFLPPLQLIIVGAVHVAQALAPLARLAAFDVVVVDPRSAFATAERFPDVQIIPSWPAEALRQLTLHRRTALVTLTHDPKLDDPALHAALASEVFYVGALGSGKTHAARKSRLLAAGLFASQVDRIHGPVGLSIGARTPAEIAVSILADVIATLRREPA